MKEQSRTNKSKNVFKRFFRPTRVSVTTNNSSTRTLNEGPLTHTHYSRSNATRSTGRNVETGDCCWTQCRCGPFSLFVVWDNVFSLKLLGSKNAIEKEEMRRQALPYFIIHPCCRFRSDPLINNYMK